MEEYIQKIISIRFLVLSNLKPRKASPVSSKAGRVSGQAGSISGQAGSVSGQAGSVSLFILIAFQFFILIIN